MSLSYADDVATWFFKIKCTQLTYLFVVPHPPPAHKKILQWNTCRRLWEYSRWELHHCLVLPHCVHLCYWRDDRCPAGGPAGHQIWKVSVRDGSLRHALSAFLLKVSVSLRRKGTLVRATVLVFIGGALMGFSRACRMPAMVIIGRFITGVHSGGLASFLEELAYHAESLALFFSIKKNLIVYIFVASSVNANNEDLQIMFISTKS